jgi:PTS system nitrogen regulatory IIA component
MSANTKAIVAELFDRGDVYYNLQGSTPEAVIGSLAKLAKLPKGVDRAALRAALLAREGLGSTAIGNGFAIPHPRQRLLAEAGTGFVAVGYLDEPVTWDAPDGAPVTTVFLLLSSSADEHLTALSGLACLANDQAFRTLVENQPVKQAIIDFLDARKSCA